MMLTIERHSHVPSIPVPFVHFVNDRLLDFLTLDAGLANELRAHDHTQSTMFIALLL
jgi:hypothetical protein